MLGLHKDPSHFPQLSPVEAEVRRRLWWYAFHLDVLVSVAAALPCLIQDSACDVRPISELKDEAIGTPQAHAYEDALASSGQHPVPSGEESVFASLISTSGLYAAGKYCDTGKITRDSRF